MYMRALGDCGAIIDISNDGAFSTNAKDVDQGRERRKGQHVGAVVSAPPLQSVFQKRQEYIKLF